MEVNSMQQLMEIKLYCIYVRGFQTSKVKEYIFPPLSLVVSSQWATFSSEPQLREMAKKNYVQIFINFVDHLTCI